jgi:hypothetical protein
LTALGEPTTETLVDGTVNGAPESWTPVAIERWRFLPGEASLRIPPLNGPQWIAADNGPIVVAIDGQGQALQPGSGIVVPAGQAVELRNPGLTEASVYRGVAATGFSLEEYDPARISVETALDTEAHEADGGSGDRARLVRHRRRPPRADPDRRRSAGRLAVRARARARRERPDPPPRAGDQRHAAQRRRGAARHPPPAPEPSHVLRAWPLAHVWGTPLSGPRATQALPLHRRP